MKEKVSGKEKRKENQEQGKRRVGRRKFEEDEILKGKVARKKIKLLQKNNYKWGWHFHLENAASIFQQNNFTFAQKQRVKSLN